MMRFENSHMLAMLGSGVPKWKDLFTAIVLALVLGIPLYSQPKIILKLDDLEAKGSAFNACIPTLDYLAANKIKSGWGVMRMDDISESQIAMLKTFMGKTATNGEALFEIWHHGLDHSRDNPSGTWEFSGTSYAFQKLHFDSASGILKNKLGITVRTFGAPYNHIDTTFLKVMSEDSNMKVLLFGKPAPSKESGILNLDHRVNMERATGDVNHDFFVSNYNASKNKFTDYIVLQGHPPKWTSDSLRNEFKKIIAFLNFEGCEFVTPYGYFRLTNKK